MKRWKKIFIAFLALNMMFFSYETEKKQAAEVGAAMTVGQLIAGGITGAALTPWLLGIAGLAAVGAVIYNWETVKSYGDSVYDRIANSGASPESFVNTDTFEVTANDVTLNAFAQAVDDVPEYTFPKVENAIQAGTSMAAYGPLAGATGYYRLPVINLNIPESSWNGGSVYIVGHIDEDIGLKYLQYYDPENVLKNISITKRLTGDGVIYYSTSAIPAGSRLYRLRADGRTSTTNYVDTFGFRDIQVMDSNAFNGFSATGTAATLSGVPATVEGRINAAAANLNGASAIPISQDVNLSGATWATITAGSAPVGTAPDLTGIMAWLSALWDAITSLPARIAAAFVALFQNMQDFLAGLWADAGLVWSGITDAVNNANTVLGNLIAAGAASLGAGIDSINDNLAGWFDNVRSGIDSINTYLGGLLQDIGAGIEAGIGSIVSGLSLVWENVTGAITGLADIVLDIPAQMAALVIPNDFTSINEKVDLTKEKFDKKFEFVGVFSNGFSSLFAARKSIYDLTIPIKGKEYPLVPIQLKPGIDAFRMFLTGSVVLFTYTSIYRRIKGRGNILA